MMKELFRKVKLYYLVNADRINKVSIVVFALTLGLFDNAFAQTTDPWGNFATLLIQWITGNLGKTLTLLGMLISVLMLLVTHSWRVFLYGIVISVIIGGLVGIAKTFFDAGSAAFGNNW